MTTRLKALRARIAALERGGVSMDRRPVSTGIDALDTALPGGGLSRGAIHEILSSDPADAAASAFLVHLLCRAGDGEFLWASCREDLWAPALQDAGLDPGRLLVARCRKGQDVLWALEEAVRSPGLAAVAGEIGNPDFAVTRRLQLAASGSGVPLFLLRSRPRRLPPSAAVTRWSVSSAAAPAASGRSRTLEKRYWRVELLRCRGGRPRSWILEKNDETHTLAVAAAADDRPDRSQAA